MGIEINKSMHTSTLKYSCDICKGTHNGAFKLSTSSLQQSHVGERNWREKELPPGLARAASTRPRASGPHHELNYYFAPSASRLVSQHEQWIRPAAGGGDGMERVEVAWSGWDALPSRVGADVGVRRGLHRRTRWSTGQGLDRGRGQLGHGARRPAPMSRPQARAKSVLGATTATSAAAGAWPLRLVVGGDGEVVGPPRVEWSDR
jgi:hypothetical protein